MKVSVVDRSATIAITVAEGELDRVRRALQAGADALSKSKNAETAAQGQTLAVLNEAFSTATTVTAEETPQT